jgi:hypothetical protein
VGVYKTQHYTVYIKFFKKLTPKEGNRAIMVKFFFYIKDCNQQKGAGRSLTQNLA